MVYAKEEERVIIDGRGYKEGRAKDSTITLPKADFEQSLANIHKGKDVSHLHPRYPGKVFRMPNGKEYGSRRPDQTNSGIDTIDDMTKGSNDKWKKGKQ